MERSILGMTFFVLGFLFLISGTYALEGNHIISNSENWEDVYSTMLFASLSGANGDFLTSTVHGPILLSSIPTSNEVGIVTSKDSPFVFNYKSTANSRGFAKVDEMEVDSANLELLAELDDIENFIIVDDSYGYSAVAVAPYAILTNSWVFLADRVNIAEIDALMERRGVKDVIVYGYVEREVNEAMEKYNPEIINTGDRFEDNVEILKAYKEIQNTKQVLLSNGEFIEREVMTGAHPVLFTGRDNVPDQIASYLKSSDIEVGVLIGNELINAATNIRRDTGISVIVKFAQGARGQTAGVSAVEGLDLFYLPTPSLALDIYSIKYNKLSSQVEITYQSGSNVPMYIQGTLTLISDAGTEKVGDLDPIFIAPNDYKTLIYPDIEMEGTDLSAEIFTLFGEAPTALDRSIRGTLDMGIINVLDKCEIDVITVKYNKQEDAFFVKVHNLEGVDCYVDVELKDVVINNVEQTLGTEGSVLVRGGKKEKIKIKQRMTNEDLEDNSFVDLAAYYGEREDTLVKVFRGKFELDIDMFNGTTYMIIIVLIALFFLIFFLVRMKRDKEW